MFKRLLTSASIRLIVLLLFFGVSAGLTWSDTTHSDRYSHIEKLSGVSFDLEERGVKSLCPAIIDTKPSLHYLPLITSLCTFDQIYLLPPVTFVPTVGRAPPV